MAEDWTFIRLGWTLFGDRAQTATVVLFFLEWAFALTASRALRSPGASSSIINEKNALGETCVMQALGRAISIR